MMTEQMTLAEARTFADKLEAFGRELSPKEQALLHEILALAASASVDVEGHTYPDPGDRATGDIREIIATIGLNSGSVLQASTG